MRFLLATGVILITTPVLAAVPTTQEIRALPGQTQVAARNSLQTLRQLVDAENVRELGFESPQQAQKANLGQPLLDYMIRLDELTKYDGGDPAKYLHATGQAVYPVLVDGKPRSSITLLRKDNAWTPLSFGEAQLSDARGRALQAIKGAAPGAADGGFQVRIPAMNAVFVAHTVNGTVMLTPVNSLPEFGLEANRTEPAKDVLARLQPLAHQIDPNVPR
jgi:hypothetical protein